ncbi:hypothetical protein F5Y15DRAFT_418691 [Xylariaceae sp. FL0016]|nr:hypothetical protein F5Y15DRAFT_418691 [Xylariaceae sp. FL0016]
MPLTPKGPALTLVDVSVIFLSLSWTIVSLRLFVRSRIRAVGTDDWLMVAGLICLTLTCLSTITSSFYGVGSDIERISDADNKKARMWLLFSQVFYALSTAPIKASICITLCRIPSKPVFRRILYAVIVLSTIAALVVDIALLSWCEPVSATWDTSTGSCKDESIIIGVSYFISAISILTDWTCAVLPAFILWDVPLRTGAKASVAVILGLGVVASSATFVRLNYILAYTDPENYLRNVAFIAIWSVTELGLGIIAPSLGTLRPLLKDIRFVRPVTDQCAAWGPMTGGRNTPFHQMSALRRSKSRTLQASAAAGKQGGWDRLSKNESQRNIVEDGGITVTTPVALRDDKVSEHL